MNKLFVIALLLSIQALLLVLKAMDYIAPLSPLATFGLWLILFTVGQVTAGFYDRRKHAASGERALRQFLVVESILTFLLLSAAVKMIFYDYRIEMARRAYDALLIAAVLNKLFWPQIRQAAAKVYALACDKANATIIRQLLVVLGSLLLIFIIFVPDYPRVLARMYIGEQFHHYDGFIMAAGWAAYNHHVMDWDQISQYGVGMPYVFAQLTRWMGGFSHEHVFLVLMNACMIYYVLAFWFCLRFFKSAALTLAILLWGIRIQMFHPGDYPFVLTYPSATIIRYFFDIFVLAAIYRHLQRGHPGWLLFAGVLSGYTIFYMDSTGVFLLLAFYAYLVCLLLMPYTRGLLYKTSKDLTLLALYFLLPLAIDCSLFWRLEGPHLFSIEFWHNFIETAEYFLSGIGTYPMYENFKYHNFYAGLVGFIIPMVWVFTLIFVGAMCYFQKFSRRHILVMVICVYGLGLNHYYVARAILTSYYVTGLPFVFVCGYWLKLLFWSWASEKRRKAIAISLLVSLYCLLTNHNFMAYPNVFNWSHNPMVDLRLTAQPLPADLSTYFAHLFRNDPQELKLPTNSLGGKDEELYTEETFLSDDDLTVYYHQNFDFSKDAALIDALTRPGQDVPLISSFETKILIQADRPPFFYYYPLLNSRPQYMRVMPLSFLHTNARRYNAKALSQLSEDRPEYVFLEKIFLYNFPKAYADKPDNIIPIVEYVRTHYTPYKAGEYLIAMKRRPFL